MNNCIQNINNETCCGCTACGAICPVGAIKFTIDEEGFWVPCVNESECINCGKCRDVCPAFSNFSEVNRDNEFFECFAMRNPNIKNLRSSSGGAFPALAKIVIEQGGLVCGCILDENMEVCHVVSDQMEDIIRMSDSKYVQSNIGDCLKIIVSAIKSKRYVLFTGTSCQVNGLLSLVTNLNLNKKYLITVDLICHGTPSPLMFKEWIAFYETEKRRKVKGYRFRSKKYGWGLPSGDLTHLGALTTSKGQDSNSFAARLWHNVFFSDLALRQYCYHCPYASINKPADITLGDFWGIESILPEAFDKKGCSLVFVNSHKGKDWVERTDLIKWKISDISKVLSVQTNLQKPTKRPDLRFDFWQDYKLYGFKYVANKYLNYSIKMMFYYQIKRTMEKMHLQRISNKLFRGVLF